MAIVSDSLTSVTILHIIIFFGRRDPSKCDGIGASLNYPLHAKQTGNGYLSRVTASGEVHEMGTVNAVQTTAEGGITSGDVVKGKYLDRMKVDDSGLLKILFSGGRRNKDKPWGERAVADSEE